MTDEKLDELIRKNTMLGDCTSQVFTFYEIKKLIKNIEAQTDKGGQAEVQVMPKIADFVAEYKETLKFDLQDAIEQQEQQNNEDFNAGREEALKYAIEMIDKHLSDFSA